MLKALLILGLGLCCFAAANETGPENDLYYSLESPFLGNRWETNLSAGYDYSNPHVHIFSAQLSQYRLLNRYLAAGLELTKFGSSPRDSTTSLQNELKSYGYTVEALAPDWSAIGVLRVTPLTGLVNFFSSNTFLIDVSLLLRAGVLYSSSMTPTFGTGIDFYLGGGPNWGVRAALLWDAQKLGPNGWESRVGFRVGPSVRF